MLYKIRHLILYLWKCLTIFTPNQSNKINAIHVNFCTAHNSRNMQMQKTMQSRCREIHTFTTTDIYCFFSHFFHFCLFFWNVHNMVNRGMLTNNWKCYNINAEAWLACICQRLWIGIVNTYKYNWFPLAVVEFTHCIERPIWWNFRRINP